MAYRPLVRFCCAVAGILLATCATVGAQPYTISERPPEPRGGVGTFQQKWTQRVKPHPSGGIASFYDDKLTATGERLNVNDTGTCSRPESSELGACLIVCRADLCIRCRVNDIGPAKRLNRPIDLTPAGFRALGMKESDGLGSVTIRRADCAHK